MCSSLQRIFWYPISTHGPGSEQILILSVHPQLRNCLLYLKICLTPSEFEILLQDFSLGLQFFFSLPSFFPCCTFFVAKLDSHKMGVHPSHPQDCIGLGWAPASTGDSWVSPKQSIAICILMKVGHILSFNVVR